MWRSHQKVVQVLADILAGLGILAQLCHAGFIICTFAVQPDIENPPVADVPSQQNSRRSQGQRQSQEGALPSPFSLDELQEGTPVQPLVVQEGQQESVESATGTDPEGITGKEGMHAIVAPCLIPPG